MDKSLKLFIELLVFTVLGCSNGQHAIIGDLKVEEEKSYRVGLIDVHEFKLYTEQLSYSEILVYPEPKQGYYTTKWKPNNCDSLIFKSLRGQVDYNLSASPGADEGIGMLLENAEDKPHQFLVAGYYKVLKDARSDQVRLYDYVYLMDTVNRRFWQIDLSKQYL